MRKIFEKYKKNFSKVKFYDSTLWKNYLFVLGIISSVVTLISFWGTASRLNIVVAVFLLIIFIIGIILIFLYMWWNANNASSVNLRINNTKVSIQEGDIFALLTKKPEERKDEISVIGVNDYYDTIVDDRVIAKRTLHGRYINQIIKDNKLKELNTIIETDEILNREDNFVEVPDRKQGRKKRYSIGSVVEFESYVLAAFTKFDDNNKAYLSAEEYTTFWMRFWEKIDEIYAGRTINIPLMGAGITRFKNGKPSKQELLEVMLWSLKISGFHNTYGDKQVNIVIYGADMEEIDFYHIQHNQNFR